MTQHSYSNAFRINPNPNQDNNLLDQGGTGVSSYTRGATLIDRVENLTPGVSQTWRIDAVQFFIGLSFVAGSAPPNYGRLGNIFAALLLAPVNPTAGAAWINPIQPFPDDLTLMTQLYNGVTDPAPPQASLNQLISAPMLSLTAGLNLPQPVEINGGETPAVGLWLTPSLLQLGGPGAIAGLTCRRSRYTIIYDDGL